MNGHHEHHRNGEQHREREHDREEFGGSLTLQLDVPVSFPATDEA